MNSYNHFLTCFAVVACVLIISLTWVNVEKNKLATFNEVPPLGAATIEARRIEIAAEHLCKYKSGKETK